MKIKKTSMHFVNDGFIVFAEHQTFFQPNKPHCESKPRYRSKISSHTCFMIWRTVHHWLLYPHFSLPHGSINTALTSVDSLFKATTLRQDFIKSYCNKSNVCTLKYIKVSGWHIEGLSVCLTGSDLK